MATNRARGGYSSGPERVVSLPKVPSGPPGGGSPRKPMSIVLAADQGSYRELLVALRSRIAKAVQDDDTPAREVAALTLRLLDIVKEIAELDAAEGTDDVGAAAGTPDEEWASS